MLNTQTSNRIDKVNSAATAFVNLVDDGIWIGIVTFTGSPITRHALTQINTQADRDSLRNIFPVAAGGGTCIGCGLERGLEVRFSKINYSSLQNFEMK